MTAPAEPHCLHIFFSDMQTHGVWPMLIEKQGSGFRHLTKPEATTLIRTAANALQALGVAFKDRVAFYGAASINFWVAEWGTLANRSVATIVPPDFSQQELTDTLAETACRVIFVERLATAQALASAGLPKLAHIICLEDGAQASGPILSWAGFLEQGRTQADNFVALLEAIAVKDMALFFYYRDENGARAATSYTHGLLYEHARKMDETIAYQTVIEKTAIAVRFKHKGFWRKMTTYAQGVQGDKFYIRNLDAVLAAVRWENPTGHIMAYYVPVLKKAAVQIIPDAAKIILPDYRPHAIIGDAEYFNRLRDRIAAQVRQAGALRGAMLAKMLELGRLKYETTEKLSPLKRLEDSIVRGMIMKQIPRLLGGRVRVMVSVDDVSHYETKLFFHVLGVSFVELLPAAPVKA